MRLPEMFRPILWSYRFQDIDSELHQEDIIINTINYGRLEHWRWMIEHYGKEKIRSILERGLVTEFDRHSRNLAKLVFSVSSFRTGRPTRYVT